MGDEELEGPERDLPILSRSQKGVSREDYERHLDTATKKFGSLWDFIDGADLAAEMGILRPLLNHMHKVAKDHANWLSGTMDTLADHSRWKEAANDPQKFSAEMERVTKQVHQRMKRRYRVPDYRPPRNQDRNKVVYEFVREYRKRKPRASFGEIARPYNSKFGSNITGKRLNKMYSDHAVGEEKFLRNCLKAAFPFETFDPGVFRSITGVE